MKLEKLKAYQSTTNLGALKPLSRQPKTKQDKPSMMELLALISRLTLYATQILRGDKKETEFITVQSCHNQVLVLFNIVDNYENRNITKKEYYEMKKAFKVRFD